QKTNNSAMNSRFINWWLYFFRICFISANLRLNQFINKKRPSLFRRFCKIGKAKRMGQELVRFKFTTRCSRRHFVHFFVRAKRRTKKRAPFSKVFCKYFLLKYLKPS